MNILVTGGAGFIGTHTCCTLLRQGHSVIVLDNFLNSSPAALTRVKQISGKEFKSYRTDLLDKAAVDNIFKENKIDAVIHFAGLKAVGESVEKPLLYYHNNLTGSINLLLSMQEHGCRRLVFSSSATVYGINNISPLTENMPLSATNPYGQTKLMIEQIIADHCAAHTDFSAVLLRYFNPIGADESGLIGESPAGIPNNIFPYISRVAAGLLPQLSVFGDDYDTVDGTGVRDYIHVSDLANGHASALSYTFEHNGCEAVNLGTGKGTSVLQLIAAFEKASGKTIPYKITARRPGDIGTCFADTRKAAALLKWHAQYGIDKMCADGWNFILKNPNGIN